MNMNKTLGNRGFDTKLINVSLSLSLYIYIYKSIQRNGFEISLNLSLLEAK